MFLRVTRVINGQLSPLEEPSASRDVSQTLVSPVLAWELQPGLSCVAAAVLQMSWGFTAFTLAAWPLSLPLVRCLTLVTSAQGRWGGPRAGSSADVN